MRINDRISPEEAKRLFKDDALNKPVRRRLKEEPPKPKRKRLSEESERRSATTTPARRRLAETKELTPYDTRYRPGTPSAFKTEFIAIAGQMMEAGATIQDLADALGVHRWTINRWVATIPEFCAVVRVGGGKADDRVEASFFERAVGYSYPSEKVFFNKDTGVVRAETVEHVPPDPGAALNWLKNRRPDVWRERSMQDITGSFDVRTINVNMTPQEAADAYMDTLRAIAATGGKKEL